MYWCKQTKKQRSSTAPLSRGEFFAQAIAFLLLMFCSLLPSCKPDNIQTGADLKYFDIKGFFTADTARLRKLNHITHKTVYHNGNSETKDVRITNWGLELSLFSQSDINKPAWRDSYIITKTESVEIYRAKDPDLKTQEITIKREGNKVKWIMIKNSTKNMLYQTKERLSYFPDSLYIIQKDQQICLFGDNRYTRKIALLSPNQYAVKGSLN
jgi:hypothetical protein